MDGGQFDNLAKAVADAVSRRSALKQVAAGASGAVLALVGVAPGDDLTAEARKRRKRNTKRHNNRKSKRHKKNKKQKKYECRKSDDCPQPSNPCEKKACNGHKCTKENREDGADCGGGLTCQNGQCVAGDPCAGVTCGPNQVCQGGACVDTCGQAGGTCAANADCCSDACVCIGPSGPDVVPDNPVGTCQGEFVQGFEQDAAGWSGNIERVPTNTDNIPAKSGGFFAKVAMGNPLNVRTRWGGYRSDFPQGGYTTETAIYIDVENAPDTDTRFDYSSAINQPNCDHRRDFVFNGGVNLVASVPTYCVSASHDGLGWPCNPERNPVVLTQSGWYTFRHVFRNADNNVLAVDLVLLDAAGTPVPNGSWTLSEPTDIIGETVGGNRYGGFFRNQFPFLAIDDTLRSS